MIAKMKSFLGESRKELRRVNWPTTKQTVRLTLIVIALSLFVAAFLGVLDVFFLSIIRSIL